MMFRTLMKKQLLELGSGFFYDQKKKRARSKAGSIVLLVLYGLLVFGLIGGMFFSLATVLCGPLLQLGFDWLYFALLGLIATLLGVFGGVFNTFSGLYNARDNGLLLSMPIPPRYILLSRLGGVYIMGLIFSAVATVPAAIVYFLLRAFSLPRLLGAVLYVLDVSVLVAALSCILGWVVAKISAKLKNKSALTVIVSLLFAGGYYYASANLGTIIEALLDDAAGFAGKLRVWAYPYYLLGRAAAGEWLPMLLATLLTAALFAAVFYVLARSFIRICTAGGQAARKPIKATAAAVRSQSGALLHRELRRFFSSPNYVLNCGMGLLFMPLAAAALLIKKAAISELLLAVFQEDTAFPALPAVLAAGAVCIMAASNDMTAPSVSLEGKGLWLIQSLPVDPWLALRAKLHMHWVLTLPPALAVSLIAVLVLRLSVPQAVLSVLLPIVCAAAFSCLGLLLNLKNPNLNWTNEMYPVKQSVSVFVTLLGGWLYAAALIGGYLLLDGRIAGELYLLLFLIVTAAALALEYAWLKKSGTRIYATL